MYSKTRRARSGGMPVRQSLRKALKRAGLLGFTIHTLRHTHATRLVQNGVSLYEVKEVLGHTDIKTTMRYAHLDRREVLKRTRDVINGLNQAKPPAILKIVTDR